MNRTWCEREPDVVEAVRRGCFSDELRGHVGSCAICAETGPVAQMLLRGASLLGGEDAASGAGVVWRLAQARKREIALKRAARPLIFMRVLSVAYMVLAAGWLLYSLWRSGSIELVSRWRGLQDETAWVGGAIAVLAIAIGAWYLLRDSGRTGEGVASM
jgi:hypothetical protein